MMGSIRLSLGVVWVLFMGRQVVFKGIDFANTGGGLRIFGHRGGGGTVDNVLYEDIRGRNMNYLLELNLWCVLRVRCRAD